MRDPKITTIKIPLRLKSVTQLYCEERGLSMGKLVRDLLITKMVNEGRLARIEFQGKNAKDWYDIRGVVPGSPRSPGNRRRLAKLRKARFKKRIDAMNARLSEKEQARKKKTAKKLEFPSKGKRAKR